MDSPAAAALTRRECLPLIGFPALGLGLSQQFAHIASGQEPAGISAPAETIAPLNRFPRMVQEHFVEGLRAAERAGYEARGKLRTKVDAEAYIADVRRKIKRSFEPFPEKTPLNPRVTGAVERDAYRVEKVIFESRPQFFVTA